MSKPIEYESSVVFGALGRLDVYASPFNSIVQGIGISASNAEVRFYDPVTLEKLAAELTKAAAALRKSQLVTFGELKQGEHFRFADDAAGHVWMKDRFHKALAVSVPFTLPGEHGIDYYAASPVVRLRASFEEVKP